MTRLFSWVFALLLVFTLAVDASAGWRVTPFAPVDLELYVKNFTGQSTSSGAAGAIGSGTLIKFSTLAGDKSFDWVGIGGFAFAGVASFEEGVKGSGSPFFVPLTFLNDSIQTAVGYTTGIEAWNFAVGISGLKMVEAVQFGTRWLATKFTGSESQ